MDFDAELRDAVAHRQDVTALACMDGRAGLVLGLYIRGDVSRADVELAVASAPQLCITPRLSVGREDDEERATESFLVSPAWVHAFARVPERPDLLVVGLAPGGSNVTLLRAWLREVAVRVGQAE